MNLCFGLLVLGVAICLLAGLGHVIWLGITGFLRAVFSPLPTAPQFRRDDSRKDRRRCVRCGTHFSYNRPRCPECSLDPTSDVARDLRDLEVTARSIQALKDSGNLNADLAEQVYESIEKWQELLVQNRPLASRTREDQERFADRPWVRLERILQVPVGELAPPDRKEALQLYRKLADPELERLSFVSLRHLAQLVNMSGLASRALIVYDMLVNAHAEHPDLASAALEAARLAASSDSPVRAKRFARIALQASLTEEQRAEAQAMLTVDDVPVVATARSPGAPISLAPVELAPASPVVPRRTWSEMLSGFMETRNILWGELVGGLLIVGCSIALVISLWQTLEKIPYFPFLIFAAITASMFGAGLYTLSHWKLESTSRGLLVIANLLVPLDFLVLAGLARGRDSNVVDWGAEVLAVVAFVALVRRSGQILTGSLGGTWVAWLLAASVVGASATQLLVLRWLDFAEPHVVLFVLLSLIPVVLDLMAIGLVLIGAEKTGPLQRGQAHGLFLFLGQSTFAAGVALAFIVYWSENPLHTFRHLAFPFTVASLPLLTVGLHVQRRLQESAKSEPGVNDESLSHGTTQMLGTVSAGLGLLVLLAATGLGWPRPSAMLAVGLLNGLVLTALAVVYRFPVFHAMALPSLALAFLTGFHLVHGEVALGDEPTAHAMIALARAPGSGVGWILVATLLAGAAEAMMRRGREQDGLYHAIGSGVAGVLAVGLVVQAGAQEPGRGAFVCGLLSIGSLLANSRWRQFWLTWAGSTGLLGFCVYLYLASVSGLSLPVLWIFALFTHATFVHVIAGAGHWITRRNDAESEKWRLAFDRPLQESGLVTSSIAALVLVSFVDWSHLPQWTYLAVWLALFWLVVAWRRREPGWWAAGQVAATAAVLLGVTDWLRTQEWVAGASGLLHWWSLQTYALGLACLTVGWFAWRKATWRFESIRSLTDPGWPTVDWLTLGVLVLGQMVLAVATLGGECARELTPVGRPLTVVVELSLAQSWLLMGLLAVVLLGHREEKYLTETVLGLLLLGVTMPVLVAQHFREELATASAYRWSASAVFLLGSAILWRRDWLRGWSNKLGWRGEVTTAFACRLLLLVTTLAPVLLLTVWVASLGFASEVPAGPLATSIFARMGWTFNIVVPFTILVIALVGHGVREDAASFIFAAGALLLVTVVGGYALGRVTQGLALDEPTVIFMAQLAAATASGWLLLWLATGRWRSPLFLFAQWSVAATRQIVSLIAALLGILVSVSGTTASNLDPSGYWLAWAALLATLISGVWLAVLWRPGAAIHVVAGCGLGFGILLSCVLEDASGWHGYHVLTLSGTVLGLLLVAGSWTGSNVAAIGPMFWSAERRLAAATWLGRLLPANWTRRWVEAISLGVVLLALGGAWGDPAKPYWSCAATLLVSVLFGAVAVWSRRPAYVHVSGLLLNLVAYLVWQAWLVDVWGLAVWLEAGQGVFDLFLLLQVVAFGAGSSLWSLVERKLRRREPPVDLRGAGMPYSHLAALAGLQVLAVLVLVALAGDVFELEMALEGFLPWAAVVLLTVALLLLLGDAEARERGLPAAPLHALGLVGVGLGLHQLGLGMGGLSRWGAVVLGAYFLLHSVLACRLRSWSNLVRGQDWFMFAQQIAGIAVLGLAWWMCLTLPELSERLLGPFAAALVLVGTWMLAQGWRDGSMKAAEYVTLAVFTLVGTEFCWALIDPAEVAPWLQRNAVELVFLVPAGVVLWLAVPRWLDVDFPPAHHASSRWAVPAWFTGQVLLWSACVVLSLFLVQEFFLYSPTLRQTPLPWSMVLVTLGLLAGVVAAMLWVATVPRHDPIGLGERGRVYFVWGAEVLAAVMLVHCRLNVPDIFPGFLGRHWALVLVLLGFVGVGLGELFQRLRLPMLAEPAHLSGLAIPLVPLAVLVARPLILALHIEDLVPGVRPFLAYLESDRMPSFETHALLWFLLGGIYGLVGVLRRQTTFGFLGALAGNFGLWVIFAHAPSLAFVLHPQLWLLPLGLIVLAAEHLHRERLGPQQSTGARYLGLALIFVSSTADLFITGLGNAVWPALVLAVLSVGGVLVGILLRLRAFLFMGVAFLFLDVFSQIWHAAVDRAQTWLWWACGIVLGIAILGLFALFEKRRNEVLKLVEDFKRWQ